MALLNEKLDEDLSYYDFNMILVFIIQANNKYYTELAFTKLEKKFHVIDSTQNFDTLLLKQAIAYHNDVALQKILALIEENPTVLCQQPDTNRITPLEYAVRFANLTAIQLIFDKLKLIDLDGDIKACKTISQYEDFTILHFAAMSNNAEVTQLLLTKLGDNAVDFCKNTNKFDKTPLDYAAEWGNAELLQLFLTALQEEALDICQRINTDQGTIMHHAAYFGNFKLIKLILDTLGKEKFSVLCEKLNADEITPIHIIFGSNNIQSIKLILENIDAEKIRAICQTVNKFDITLLNYAINSANPEIVKLIINILSKEKFITQVTGVSFKVCK